MTEVRAYNGFALLQYGHISRSEAIQELQSFAEGQRDQAEATLACIAEGNVQVWHQRGIYLVRDRVEVAS